MIFMMYWKGAKMIYVCITVTFNKKHYAQNCLNSLYIFNIIRNRSVAGWQVRYRAGQKSWWNLACPIIL